MGGVMSLLPLLLLSVCGFILYRKFNSPLDIASDKADKISVKNFQSNSSSQSIRIDSVSDELKKRNLTVSAQHRSIADAIHFEIDSMWQNEEKIVSLINSINADDSVRLVNVAYGLRKIETYRRSHLILKELPFLSNDLYGDLKSHLMISLNDSQLKSISARFKLL